MNDCCRASFADGVHFGGQPTVGAVRRLRGWTMTDDPQAETVKAIASEVESMRRALGRGARPDEVRARALRLARLCEGAHGEAP